MLKLRMKKKLKKMNDLYKKIVRNVLYPLRKQRKSTVSSAKRKAWSAFSLYIRTKDSVDGVNECYTCGKIYPVKRLQAGHWIEGHANTVYINEDYVRVQCYSCNVIKHGNQGVFRDKIRAELGSDVVDQLILEANQTKDLTLSDYIELEKYYKGLLSSTV